MNQYFTKTEFATLLAFLASPALGSAVVLQSILLRRLGTVWRGVVARAVLNVGVALPVSAGVWLLLPLVLPSIPERIFMLGGVLLLPAVIAEAVLVPLIVLVGSRTTGIRQSVLSSSGAGGAGEARTS